MKTPHRARDHASRLIATAALSVSCCCAHAGVNSWMALGPDGGNALDVEFAGTDPRKLYILARSGLYRSALSANSWELLKEDFGSVPRDSAMDPTDANRVLVAAADGVFLSTDGGATFSQQYEAHRDGGIRVEVSHDGTTMYFARGTQLFRSLDRGVSWEERGAIHHEINQRLIHGLEVDPTAATTVYASGLGIGIFASYDGGGVWQQLGATVWQLVAIENFVVDPSNPQRLLAATTHGLLISDDRGLSWAATSLTGRVTDVDVDPANSSVIYVAHEDGTISKSADSGSSWSTVPVNVGGYGAPSFGAGAPSIAIDPAQSATVTAFGGDGVMISTDYGATWTKRVAGLHATSPGNLSYVASSGRFYFGDDVLTEIHYVESGAVHAVNNAALQALAAPFGGVQVLALPGAGADTLFAVLRTCQPPCDRNPPGALAKSVDGGANWSLVATLPAAATVFWVAASPREPQTVYAATSAGIYKSFDGGASWTISNAGLSADVTADTIVVASQPAVLYATTHRTTPGAIPPISDYRIYKSLDAGASWSLASPPEEPREPWDGSLTVHPRDPNVVYVVKYLGTLHKTTDGGASWTRLDTELWNVIGTSGFEGFAIDPANPRVLYAGYTGGVLRSTNDGATWQTLTTESPGSHFRPSSIAVDPSNTRNLLIAAPGFGIRQTTVPSDGSGSGGRGGSGGTGGGGGVSLDLLVGLAALLWLTRRQASAVAG